MRQRRSGTRSRPRVASRIVVLPIDQSKFRDVISRVPALVDARDLDVRPLEGGLTNRNYLVTAGDEQFVVRIVGENGPILVPDRAVEEAAMRRAVDAGISPEVVAFVQPEGHVVTRYLAGARPLTIPQFESPEMIPRMAERIKQVHELAPIEGRFDSYASIRQWLAVLDVRGTRWPSRLATLLERVGRIEAERTPIPAGDLVLCHNDPYHLNFLDDGELWLIDWEYAGMGDVMYDLGFIGYMLDAEGRDLLLSSYFGSVTAQHRNDLEALICVALCWNVCWSLIQIQGGVPGVDYLSYAERLLDRVPPH